MTEKDKRTESDSLGEIEVPAAALYAAQTQRAIQNFNISGLALPASFIAAVAQIKKAAAQVNADLGLLPPEYAVAISSAADEIIAGQHGEQFPIDVFQTGSGTSTNMNLNEVIAGLCKKRDGLKLHPNDHVNLGQSSNDVIPTAIQLSALLELEQRCLPAIKQLIENIDKQAAAHKDSVKTGRTHLMDAMPISFAQEFSAWSAQLRAALESLTQLKHKLAKLPQGGTAVGSGVNTHGEFAARFTRRLTENLVDQTTIEFAVADNFFASISSQDLSVSLSGQLKVLATALYKIATDLRWMNSGPLAGLAEIELATLQPGSSIMPGKVNPVIPEAVSMACAQVVGNDATITMAGTSGNFQLNVMLPLIAYNLLQSIELLGNSATHLGQYCFANLKINRENIDRSLHSNPVLATALTPEIGYDAAARIAKEAYRSNRPIIDVAREQTDLDEQRLTELLSPMKLTHQKS